jgi:hypothetical protein
MTKYHESVRAFIWALCLITGSSYGQSSLPLKAGQVFVDRIDVASNKKIRLPDGRWVVMGLHTRETPLTGGTRTSQTVEHVSLMNENENAPLQYLSIAWTTFANVNWTAQPCDSYDSVKNRPIKDTFNTNTASLTIKCSALIYDSNFGNLNNFSTSVPLTKDLWQPIAENRRIKPQDVANVYGYISKNRSDFIAWNLYINPKSYGLDQASDTRYKVPANEREIIANNLLKYSADWNKLYIQEVEKDFFPGLFQSASASVERFNFQERVEAIKVATTNQISTQSIVNGQPVDAVTQSQLPPCRSGEKHNCVATENYADGGKYVGEFKDSKRNGLGTYTYPNGGKYVGAWRESNRNGQGTMTYADGGKYVGEFKDGKRHGQGTLYFLADNQWKGDKYVGEYKDDQRTGQGTYYHLADNQWKGDKQVGEYKDGKRIGQGTYTYANGNKFVGEYIDNKRNGQGIEYTASGSIIRQGRWENNNLVQSLAIDTQRFPFNAPTQTAQTSRAEIDRINAEAQAARQQELEKRLATQAIEAEAAKRRQQELEAQLAAAQSTTQAQPISVSIRSAHALVIGNAAYPGSNRLDNTINDANAISQKLRSMGFTVTTVKDTNRQQLVQAMSQFKRTAANAELSLFFYAGHGVQIFGTNYILPTDVDQNDVAQATIQGVSLNSVVENFLPGKTKLVFLDACRDNPLQRSGDRSVSKGLAPISVAQGTLISYATKDGQTASDGVGAKNSPFTQALLQHLDDPADIAVVLRKVREKVMLATAGKQQPWEYGSLIGGELVLSKIKGGR